MRTLVATLIALLSATAQAGSLVQVKNVRVWQAPDSLRMVFDISAPAEHKLFLLSNPDRVVIDLKHAEARGLDLSAEATKHSWLKAIRTAPRPGGDYRVVLDLTQRVTPSSFILQPNAQYGHRLVIDLKSSDGSPEPAVPTPAVDTAPAVATPVRPPVEVKSINERNSGRNIIIAIDAGHGGEDPGALGHRGTHEKDVVLTVARRLRDLVNKEPGMRAVMIRDGDYYVSLRDRVNKARDAKADLLVSIHADAYKNPQASGSSVFALSPEGATSEAARWLAESENASDLIGGVSLDDKDEVLASVLLDLSQTASIEASLDVGKNVLGHLKQVGKVHKGKVEQAGFVVLKSPDVPSILVETAFISNPLEERKLKTEAHQNALAAAVLKGVRDHFTKNPPPGTHLAMRNAGKQAHVVRSGDTLSSLSRRYNIPSETIRTSNALESDSLRVGEVIHIPLGT